MGDLDPQARALLDLLEQAGSGVSMTAMSLAEARALFDAGIALDRGDPVAAVADRAVRGPGGDLRLRIYTPLGPPPFPVTVFFHGGGWTIGSLDSHDLLCRSLAARSGSLVVAVEYRLAPENPHPAAVDDALAAVHWAFEHQAELGGRGGPVAVAGDSAGGNLAAVAAIADRDAGAGRIGFQALIYPAVDDQPDSPSMRENSEGYFLTRELMEWFIGNYAGDQDRGQATLNPMRAASLAGVPPAIVVTAEFDPLRDQGNAYADRLRREGVATVARCYPGMIHGFISMRAMIGAGDRALDEIAAAIRAGLSGSESGD